MAKSSLDLFNELFDKIKLGIAFCDQWSDRISEAVYGKYSIFLPLGAALKTIDQYGCKTIIIGGKYGTYLITDNGYYLSMFRNILVEGKNIISQTRVETEDFKFLSQLVRDSKVENNTIAKILIDFMTRKDVSFYKSTLPNNVIEEELVLAPDAESIRRFIRSKFSYVENSTIAQNLLKESANYFTTKAVEKAYRQSKLTYEANKNR